MHHVGKRNRQHYEDDLSPGSLSGMCNSGYSGESILTDTSAQMNPFISFCLYVSARVFVQYLKSRPDDSQTADSLRFLLAAMNALKRRNPLTESFLVQLDVDLEALGARIPKLKSAFPRSSDSVSVLQPIHAVVYYSHSTAWPFVHASGHGCELASPCPKWGSWRHGLQ